MTEKFQLDNPNSHYLANMSNLNRTNNTVQLGRLPTLGEILANITKSPINLYSFYLYSKIIEEDADYLDFWFDLINHSNLCKHYVQGLRESIIRSSSFGTGTGTGTGSGVGAGNKSSLYGAGNSIPDHYSLTETDTKHKSLSSSMLLELIINDHILEENDTRRLSQFLRGDIDLDTVDPRLKEIIESYGDESLNQPSIHYDRGSSYLELEKRVSSQSGLLETSSDSPRFQMQQGDFRPPEVPGRVHRNRASNRHSSLNPSFVEKLIKDASITSSFFTREQLKESSHNILLKYFVEDSENSLDIPRKLNEAVIKAIEVDGRDDPGVFDGVKLFILNRLETKHLPGFLNFVAIKNINKSVTARVIIGFLMIFFSFWIAFSLIFLNELKRYRCVVIFTFFCGFYGLVSSIYKVDPILALWGRSESFIPNHVFIKIEDKFIHKLLLKRAAWALILISVPTAIFSVLFCLVPGKRL